MIARILLFIKHHLPWLWHIVEWLNTRLFRVLHQDRMQQQIAQAFEKFKLDGFKFRPLNADDLDHLHDLIQRQGSERLKFFQPHGFDKRNLRKAHANPAFFMFGVFREEEMVGYFFLRCFWNRKCFVGRLIDEPFEGQGIGRVMNDIMYHIAWWSIFRCFTTVSKNNTSVIRSHSRNPHVKVADLLSGDYLLLEFLELTDKDQNEALRHNERG